MHRRPSILLGLIAVLLAAFGPLVTAAPARAMAASQAMAAMPDDCPMHRHAGKAGHADGAPVSCACCYGQVAAEAPASLGPVAPSVTRQQMAPVAELTGGPGRSIPPALGPPRA